MKSSQHVSALRSAAERLQAAGHTGEAETWFRRALTAGTSEGEGDKGLAAAVASTANNLAMLLRGVGGPGQAGAEVEELLRSAAHGFAQSNQQAAQLRPTAF